MRTPVDNLYMLISSMTAAEKRYFKVHFYRKGNKLSRLYDFLVKMKRYDEAVVKRYFSKDKLSANLKVYKRLLYDLLLKSLMSNREPADPMQEVLRGLDAVILLEKRGLYVEVYRRLEKLKLIAERANLAEYTLILLQYEIRFLHRNGFQLEFSPQETFEKQMEISSRLETVIRKSEIAVELSAMGLRIAHYTNNNELKSEAQRKELEDFLNGNLLNKQVERTANSSVGHYFLSLQASALTALGRHQEARATFLAILQEQYVKANELVLAEKQSFVSVCINFLHCSALLRDYEGSEEWIARAKRIIITEPTLVGLLALIHASEVKMLLNKGLLERMQMIREGIFSRHLKNFQNLGLAQQSIVWSYCILDLVDGLFESCLKTIEELQNWPYMRSHYLSSVRAVQLICHYELGDHPAIRLLLRNSVKQPSVILQTLENAFARILEDPTENERYLTQAHKDFMASQPSEQEEDERVLWYWLQSKRELLDFKTLLLQQLPQETGGIKLSKGGSH